MFDVRRRQFIALLGGAAGVVPAGRRNSPSGCVCDARGTGFILLLPRIAKRHHDLRRDREPYSRARKQRRTDDDVMQVAGASVPIAPSGPSSHDPCRCPHAEKNDSGIDRNNHKGHAAETKAALARHYTAAKAATIPVRSCQSSRCESQSAPRRGGDMRRMWPVQRNSQQKNRPRAIEPGP